MELLEALRTRSSIGKVRPDPVDRALIEQMLESATWAPNHHHTEPWRFWVLTGEGRRPLGRAMAAMAAEKMDDANSPENQEKLQKEEAKAFRAPVIIAVAVQPSDRPNVVPVEEFAAVSAAAQNMLLAAHALGLGAVLRTGGAAYDPAVKRLFGLGPEEDLLGFIYVGYPDMEAPKRHRAPIAEKTTWVEGDQAEA